MTPAFSVHFLSEVLVVRYQNSCFGQRSSDDEVIGGLRHLIRHSYHVMAKLPETLHYSLAR